LGSWRERRCRNAAPARLNVPRNYRLPLPDRLYGEANAVTIPMVGKELLNKAMIALKLPITPTWRHIRTHIEALWQDGSLRDAVAEFSGKLKEMGRDTSHEIVVPLVIREGVVLEPALFRSANHTDIWTKEAFVELFRGEQFPRPMLDREYIYGLPPLPGCGVPNKMLSTALPHKEQEGGGGDGKK
jgi:hypothetical protein